MTPQATGNCEQQALARRLLCFVRPTWRTALSRLGAPAVRLHRYRNLRTELLHDTLCPCRDCCERRAAQAGGDDS